jgi:GAF domain-containing protein
VISGNQQYACDHNLTIHQEDVEALRQEIIELNRALIKKQAEIEGLSTISQSMAQEINFSDLFRVVHTEIERIMGEIDFMIAIYDKLHDLIEIPYACEDGEMLYIQPFPLGDGLTSILIKTGQSLRIDENVEHRARELGATVGTPAKSWLGVPLIVSGEPIGAMIMQDLHQERRFSEGEHRLLSILAGQVAVAIRNVILLEKEKLRGEREHLLNEISSKIRQPIDLSSILEITANELGVSLDLCEVTVEINYQEPSR